MMVPKSEMWKILSAAKYYIGWARHNQIREIVKNVQANSPTDPITRNGDFLDDKCHFDGQNYKVRQLIEEIGNKDSEVGVRFAEEVYTRAQRRYNRNAAYGRRRWVELTIENYRHAIHKVTHPNTK